MIGTMSDTPREARTFWRPVHGLLFFLALLALAGCAGTHAPASGTTSATMGEPYTESDEPEARRRARIRTELASAYLGEGKVEFALDEIKQAQAADPNYSPAYTVRGVIHLQMQDRAGAMSNFQRAIQLNPRDADALHNLGFLHCDAGQFAQAQPLFERALQVPGYARVGNTWLAQGVCQARAGQLEPAERSLSRALEYDAGNPITIYNLAAVLLKRGEAQRAQFHARRLNNSELANAESLWLGVRIERRLGNQEAVRQLGDQLRRRFPDSTELAAFNRGAFDD